MSRAEPANDNKKSVLACTGHAHYFFDIRKIKYFEGWQTKITIRQKKADELVYIWLFKMYSFFI